MPPATSAQPLTSAVPLGGDLIEVVAPIREGTTAGRLLEKRGEGGYMLIMQTADAKGRRNYIEAQGLATVIFGHERDDVVCVQYHPRGIRGMLHTAAARRHGPALTAAGGVMPELDSHAPGRRNPTPVASRFSPWHACGSQYERYSAAMERSGHLGLGGCALRLRPDESDCEAAARQWEDLFGVARSWDSLTFVNARLRFLPGRVGQPEGLVSITVRVSDQISLDAIVERAKQIGACADGGITMCGISWKLSVPGHSETSCKGRL
jgi:hypothetical protein